MGNQNSKDAGAASSKAAGNGDEALQSYPSFSRSDTRDSSRSFRSLRSKIPGSGKTDSPRGSAILTNGDLPEKSDAASVKSGRSGRSPPSRTTRADSYGSPSSPSSADTGYTVGSPLAEDLPPPLLPFSRRP